MGPDGVRLRKPEDIMEAMGRMGKDEENTFSALTIGHNFTYYALYI